MSQFTRPVSLHTVRRTSVTCASKRTFFKWHLSAPVAAGAYIFSAACIILFAAASICMPTCAFAQEKASAVGAASNTTEISVASNADLAECVKADSAAVSLLKKFEAAKTAGKLLEKGELMPYLWMDLIEYVRDFHGNLLAYYWDALAEGRDSSEASLVKVRSTIGDIVKKFEQYGYWTCVDLDEAPIGEWASLDDIRTKAMVASELAKLKGSSEKYDARAVHDLCESATSELAVLTANAPAVERHPAFARTLAQTSKLIADCSGAIAGTDRAEDEAMGQWRELQKCYDGHREFFEAMAATNDLHELDLEKTRADIAKFEKEYQPELNARLERFSTDFGSGEDAIRRKFNAIIHSNAPAGLDDPGCLYASLSEVAGNVAKMKKALSGEAVLQETPAEAAPTTREIFLRSFGDSKNPAVVFLHGGPGYNSFIFEYSAAQALADSGYFVVVYDQRGQGRSKIASAKFTLDEYVADLKNICDKFNAPKVTLIGHSFGGLVALRFARAYPAAVERIIFVAAPFDYPAMFKTILGRCREFYSKNAPESLKYIEMIEKSDSSSLEYENYCFAHALNCGLYMAKNISEDAKKIYESLSRLPDAKLMTESYNVPVEGFWRNEHYSSKDYSAEVALLPKTVRLYGIYGRDDGLFDDASLSGIKSLLGEANFTIVDNASHNVFADQRSRFIELVNKYR